MPDKSHILLIDDEKNYLLVLETLLTDAGYTVTPIADPETALAFLDQSEVDVIITDLKMPKMSGRDVLKHAKKNYPHIPILIMTAFGSIESAVDLMKDGAFDYITKPFSNEDLLISIHNAADLAQAHRQYRLLQESVAEKYATHHIIGQSKVIRDLRIMIEKAALLKTSILISGESGTGKKLIAKAIHYSSPRKDKPFIGINCKAYNSAALETELFGTEKDSNGALAVRRGKIEQAYEGTLFLEDISECTPDMQIKLFETLKAKQVQRIGGRKGIEIDVRIIASTSKNLKQMIAEETFHEDLYYLINVIEISVPPLRERREDIPELVSYFSHSIAKENNLEYKKFTPEALNYLSGYEWQGNIRQLQNIIERCIVLVPNSYVTDNDLPPEIRDEEGQFKSAVDLLPPELNLADTLDKIEAALVRRALVRAEFIQSHAADALGISRSLMQYKLKKYNITGH